jgi:murein DD-endopeptidase MepM/ murein hydrolase activator NlpD
MAIKLPPKITAWITWGVIVLSLMSSCAPTGEIPAVTSSATPNLEQPTPMPTRPKYSPGELVDYTAQSGDTLPALAAHFNTTEKEIRDANSILPEQVTTLPAGLPMKIPIYYRALWGSSFQIIPDSMFVNGTAQVGFDTVTFVNKQPGWLKNHREYADGQWLTGGQIIDYIAVTYSVSPHLLLALLEYQAHALTDPVEPTGSYPLGNQDPYYAGLYSQLIWAANTLNNGYYGWRTGKLVVFDHMEGTQEAADPWQNAATVGIQYYFAQVLPIDEYTKAISSIGLSQTFETLFGNPWDSNIDVMPGSLQQPAMSFPFQIGKPWTFTGGPHTGWGTGDPFAALDFAPPVNVGGCFPSDEWVTAVADGVIARTDTGLAVLDLDGDGDERTGWDILYLHLASNDKVAVGTHVHKGDPIGHPSCEGGEATGTHVHIARKYNGEWVPAGGPLAFVLDGWTVHSADVAYQGSITNQGHVINACVCSDINSRIVITATPATP